MVSKADLQGDISHRTGSAFPEGRGRKKLGEGERRDWTCSASAELEAFFSVGGALGAMVLGGDGARFVLGCALPDGIGEDASNC